MPRISVIVPVYKAEAYLEECVNSVLSQSFPDFELILADDGSPDRCPELCEEFAARDARIRVFHQENQGQAAARNLALQHAAGEWVCFVDSDDAIHPQMLELLYREAQESGAAIIGCSILESAAAPADFSAPRQPSYERLRMCEETIASLYYANSIAYWSVCAGLIRKSISVDVPMTPGRFYEDNAVKCKWLYAADCISLTEEKLYFYRINPNGTTKSGLSLKILDFLWALREQLTFYREIGYREMENIIAGRYLRDARYYYFRILEELHQQEKAEELLRNMTAIFRQYQKRAVLTDREREKLREMLPPTLRERIERKAKSILPFVK